MHAEQLAFQDPGAMAPQSVRSAAWHRYCTAVLSHHLYHWQQLLTVTAASLPVALPSMRTVGVNPVAGGGGGNGGG